VPADVVRTYAVCFGGAPADWAQRFERHRLDVAGGADFELTAVTADGATAFGRYRSGAEQGVGAVRLTTGALTKVAPLAAEAAGVGWMSADGPWVVWEQGESSADLGDWTVRAWNQATGEALVLGTSRQPDGGEVFGQIPFPVVRRGLVAWAQPQPQSATYPEGKVELYDLARRQATVLDSGRVSGPVFAGADVVWARLGPDGAYALRAVDASTLKPDQLPGRVARPGSVLYLAGSSRYLAWTSGQRTLTTWQIGSNQYGVYTTDVKHPLQFLELAGDFVVWYAGSPSSVLDLRTGHAFDVQGTLAGSDAVIAESAPSGGARAPKASQAPSSLAYAPLSAATRISGC
jgi:hypothetical protein